MSETADVPIVAATCSTATHYPDGHWSTPPPLMSYERVISDLEVGMDPADWTDPDAEPDQARAGAIKAGASYHHAKRRERRRLEAAAIGSFRAGVPILVHTEIGTFAHEIVTILEGTAWRRTASSWRTSTATPTPSSMPRSPTAG